MLGRSNETYGYKYCDALYTIEKSPVENISINIKSKSTFDECAAIPRDS